MGKKRPFRPQSVSAIDRVESAKNRAQRLVAEKRLDEAVELLSEELAKAPHRTDILLVIAKILITNERLPEAVDTLIVLKAHLPNNAEVVKLLGLVLSRMRHFEKAAAELIGAHRLTPGDPEILIALSQNYERLNNVPEATKWLFKAVELVPKDVELRCYAAGILNHAGEEEKCREMLLSDPEIAQRPEVQLLEAMLMPIVASSKEEILQSREHYRSTLLCLASTGLTFTKPSKKVLATNFLLGYHGLEDRELIELSARTIRDLYPELAYVSPSLERRPLAGRRIKVGFVSSNLRKHSVGRVLNQFLKELNRRRFEVFLFEVPGKFKGGQEESRKLADKTIFLPEDLEGSRALIEREEPDILVLPDFVLEPKVDHLAHSRLAPVQCTTWGHPGTSGRPSIDYWISCADWEPDGNERLYTEKLVRLSSPPMIVSMSEIPAEMASRESLGIPEGRIYGCAQPLYKIHPDYDDVMAEILRRDPLGHLVLIRGAQQGWVDIFTNRFQAKHSDLMDRITILPFLKFHDYVSLLSHLAVFLDPTEFGGAITSIEALTVGTPIVTWPGTQLRNRVTYSLYRMMDFMDLVVDSKEAYVELALKVAQDTDYREEMVRAINEKKGAIFDKVEITRELESFFEDAVKKVIAD